MFPSLTCNLVVILSLILLHSCSVNCNVSGQTFGISWRTLEETLPEATTDALICLYNNRIYIIGGYTHNHIPINNTSIEHKIPSTNIYSISLPSLLSTSTNNPLLWDPTGTWQNDTEYGYIQHIAGIKPYAQEYNLIYMTAPSIEGKMLIYDLDTQSQIAGNRYQWPMPISDLQEPCTVSNGSHLFAVGGVKTGGIASNSTQIYDIEHDVWYLGAEMKYQRNAPQCIYYTSDNGNGDGLELESRNILFVFGGRYNDISNNNAVSLNSIEYYDITKNKWYLLKDVSLQFARSYGHVFIAFDWYIFTIGGYFIYNDSNNDATFEEYTIDQTEIFEIDNNISNNDNNDGNENGIELNVIDLNQTQNNNNNNNNNIYNVNLEISLAQFGFLQYNESMFLTFGGFSIEYFEKNQTYRRSYYDTIQVGLVRKIHEINNLSNYSTNNSHLISTTVNSSITINTTQLNKTTATTITTTTTRETTEGTEDNKSKDETFLDRIDKSTLIVVGSIAGAVICLCCVSAIVCGMGMGCHFQKKKETEAATKEEHNSISSISGRGLKMIRSNSPKTINGDHVETVYVAKDANHDNHGDNNRNDENEGELDHHDDSDNLDHDESRDDTIDESSGLHPNVKKLARGHFV